jgi:hypothetical protein
MNSSRTSRITRALSEGTGLSQEEIGVLMTAAAVGTAVIGVLRVADVVMYLWPPATRRQRTA